MLHFSLSIFSPCYRVGCVRLMHQVFTSITDSFQMRNATAIISTGQTPNPMQDIQSRTPDKKKKLRLPDSRELRANISWVDFHNYTNKQGRISIKVISWTIVNLASFYLSIISQLEHLQKCKVIHANTCKYAQNLARLPLLPWPGLHVFFTHLWA